MKVAILAGGAGTRIAEETAVKPKPMVEIGGKPILWHIMRHYLHHGFHEFLIALGYKGHYIKRYMLDYSTLSGNLKIDCKHGHVDTVSTDIEEWSVELIETGEETGTGGRILRLKPYLAGTTFLLTWGDGVSNVDLQQLLAFHRSHGRLATVTAVHPPARFGRLQLDGDQVLRFDEKPVSQQEWINGAFFALETGIFDYIDGDQTMWEREPMERLASDGQLMAYRHEAFWQCMDTIHDKQLLERLWQTGQAPWKTWE